MTDFNSITPVATVQSASPFHSVSYVDVMISANPDDRQVYRQGSVKVGGQYENTFSLSYVALSMLMNAAGIEEASNHRVDDRSHPHFCAWQFSAKWTQPDSTVLAYSSDYELDLRDWIDIGGGQRVMAARFEKAVADERQSIIEKKFPQEVGSLKYDAKTAKCDSLYAGLSEDDKREVTDLAEAKAIRGVVQRRQFIVQLAQTGAMERTIRKMLNLKSQYTASELKKPFRVPRSRYDWDRLDAVLGPEMALELRQAQALKLLGLTAADLSQARQLAAPQSEHHPVLSEELKRDDEALVKIASKVVADVVEAAFVKTDAEMSEPPLAPDEMLFRGQTVKKNDLVGTAFSKDSELKEWFQNSIVSKYPGTHYKRHLKDHFGKESAVNLTWHELGLLARHTINNDAYPPEYAGKQSAKPSKASKSKETSEERSVRLGVEPLVQKIIMPSAFAKDPARASELTQLVTDACDAVEGETSTLEEIEQFFKEQVA